MELFKSKRKNKKQFGDCNNCIHDEKIRTADGIVIEGCDAKHNLDQKMNHSCEYFEPRGGK